MNLDDLPEYLTVADLEAYGLIPEDVRRLCPAAVELTALDGSPCWSCDELAPLLGGRKGGDEA